MPTLSYQTQIPVTGEYDVIVIGPAGLLAAAALCVRKKCGTTVLLSRISRPEKECRRDMEIRVSHDGGNTFPTRFALPAGTLLPGTATFACRKTGKPLDCFTVMRETCCSRAFRCKHSRATAQPRATCDRKCVKRPRFARSFHFCAKKLHF